VSRRLVAVLSLALIAAAALAAVLWTRSHPYAPVNTASRASATPAPLVVGGRAPDFSVASTAGLFELNDQTKPVFLEVFATWCPHCQRETAVLNALYRQFGSRVAFIAVSGSDVGMDHASPESQLDVLNFQTKFGPLYPIAYDGQLKVASLYLQGGYPTIVIIDKGKRVRYASSGEVGVAELRAQLEKVTNAATAGS